MHDEIVERCATPGIDDGNHATGSEAIDGPGDGSSEPDYVITGALTLELRAERSGILVGRTYTVSVECGDGSGNTTTRSVDVTV